jgi:hypothetical protein
MLTQEMVHCPYCGETFETTVDASAGEQDYVEDCQVCCRPIQLRITLDHAGRLRELQARRDDD